MKRLTGIQVPLSNHCVHSCTPVNASWSSVRRVRTPLENARGRELMEKDNELEGQLLQQFSSLGTTDKDVLISEFQKLIGNQLNPGECTFYLDMNNWNLQAAVLAYYEYNKPSNEGPQFKFIGDITEGEGEYVPSNTIFTKTWRISNSGEERWPPGCHVKFCEGENLSLTDGAIVDALEPGQAVDVTMLMQSGEVSGTFQSKWRMSTGTGLLFGEPIWVIVTVAERGVLGVKQQVSKFGTDFLHTSIPVIVCDKTIYQTPLLPLQNLQGKIVLVHPHKTR